MNLDANYRIYYIITTNKIINESLIRTKSIKDIINEMVVLRNPATLKEMQNMSLEYLNKIEIELFVAFNQGKEHQNTCLELIYLLNSLQS